MNAHSIGKTAARVQPWAGIVLIAAGYFAVIDFAWVVISVAHGSFI